MASVVIELCTQRLRIKCVRESIAEDEEFVNRVFLMFTQYNEKTK